MFGGLAHGVTAQPIGNDQSGRLGENGQWHLGRGGEEQPVAMPVIVAPLVVSLEVRNRGLDLNDPQLAGPTERDNVGASSGGQTELAKRGAPQSLKQPRGPACHRRGGC